MTRADAPEAQAGASIALAPGHVVRVLKVGVLGQPTKRRRRNGWHGWCGRETESGALWNERNWYQVERSGELLWSAVVLVKLWLRVWLGWVVFVTVSLSESS